MVYLDIAEEQTLNQKPMYMKDRQKKIDDYLHDTAGCSGNSRPCDVYTVHTKST